MPFIDWKSLPKGVRKHLEDRLKLREVTEDDMVQLARWIRTNPEVPDGPWCKDFGGFKLAGNGSFPKTFLTRNQSCVGKRI
jgi:hypothetical protein